MINYGDFCEKFCEIEKRYNLFDLEYNNVKYWKYARYYVYNAIYSNLYGKNVPYWFNNDKKEEWIIPRYSHKYQKFTDLLFHNINIGFKKDVMLFTFGRRIKNGKKYICPVTDEVSLQLARSHCIVETPFCDGYFRPAPIRGIKYFDVWEKVGEKDKVYVPINRGQLRKQLLSIFEEEFGFKFTSEEKKILLVNINHFIMYRDELMANYKKILTKISPKVVIYTSSYTGINVALTEVLKEMKIPGIELLHGYVVETTIPYNYIETGINDTLPDYIFVFSQIQKDVIKWGIPKSNIRVVGWPWLEKKKNELSINKNTKNQKRTITFISSTDPVIQKYMNVLVRELDKSQFEIIFKLHPTEFATWKEQYNNLPDNIQVIDNNEFDVHYYLARTDYVIGINSTALFEAAIYPVKIFILEEEGWQEMSILLRAGGASFVHDERELLTLLKNDTNHNTEFNTNFYAPNAIENINNEIENIIKERI